MDNAPTNQHIEHNFWVPTKDTEQTPFGGRTQKTNASSSLGSSFKIRSSQQTISSFEVGHTMTPVHYAMVRRKLATTSAWLAPSPKRFGTLFLPGSILLLLMWHNMYFTSLADWWDHSLHSIPKDRKRAFNSLDIYTMWNLWKERNCRVF
jgi:hypothetical protein